jgi:hypothetical protein
MLSAAELDNDLFVSYAHIDDQALTEGEKGWISTFHRALEVRLGQILGKTPRIFRDPKLQGNDYFADRLVETLPRTAALVSVVSPRYIRSDWCRRELEEFCRASERTGGMRVADKARVFKVVKTPVPLDQHPSELQELLGYDFFVIEGGTGRPRELSHLSEPEMQRRYWARLDDLAHDISELLQILETGAAPATPAGEPGSKGTIWLAETSFDLQERRDTVKRELLGHGYAVLPDRPLPLLGPECESLVREQLARCRMSIHMVGRNYGIVPEGVTRSVVELQNELAIERGAAGGFSRLIWMPPGLELEDERQRRFVAHLQTDVRLEAGVDLLEAPLEELKTVLYRRLAPPPEPPARARDGSTGEDGPGRIYLLCDQRDLDRTPVLEDYLFERGFEVVLPVFEGDEAQVRRDHEESLALSDAVLLYYGEGNELWLRQKLRELQKCAAYGRSRPLQAKAVYVAPPDTLQKRRFRTHEAEVIQQFEKFSPDAIERFLSPFQPAGRIFA